MEGVFVNQKDRASVTVGGADSYLSLLAKRKDLEIMVQTLRNDATVWISPAEDRDTLEFFYILSGGLVLCLKNEQEITLQAGESFYVEGINSDLHIKMLQETKLLYITNRSVFDYVFGYQGDLNDLLHQIDIKDNYTYEHCCNVMNYSKLLMSKMKKTEAEMYDIVTASLFHDVGKCFVPDEILRKPEKLTSEEFRKIMKHPIDGARLLEQKFSQRIADIAKTHHERLDGSGYPYGLSGDEISFEGRIIAVADSFDAMTTKRTYNRQKSYLAAAEELCNMPQQYDHNICLRLKELVLAGEIPFKGETL